MKLLEAASIVANSEHIRFRLAWDFYSGSNLKALLIPLDCDWHWNPFPENTMTCGISSNFPLTKFSPDLLVCFTFTHVACSPRFVLCWVLQNFPLQIRNSACSVLVYLFQANTRGSRVAVLVFALSFSLVIEGKTSCKSVRFHLLPLNAAPPFALIHEWKSNHSVSFFFGWRGERVDTEKEH